MNKTIQRNQLNFGLIENMVGLLTFRSMARMYATNALNAHQLYYCSIEKRVNE